MTNVFQFPDRAAGIVLQRLADARIALLRSAIMRFATGQQDSEKPPFSICECVNLRIAPSARAANSLLLLPPLRRLPSGALSRAWS